MRQLSPRHIDNCAKEVSRWTKAIRLINLFEDKLPEGFPEPDLIEPDKKPYELKITWRADNSNHSDKLCERVAKAFAPVGNTVAWRRDATGHFEARGYFQLNKKAVGYLRLIVTDGRTGQATQPFYN